jgi:hypothetical protein
MAGKGKGRAPGEQEVEETLCMILMGETQEVVGTLRWMYRYLALALPATLEPHVSGLKPHLLHLHPPP